MNISGDENDEICSWIATYNVHRTNEIESKWLNATKKNNEWNTY